jgi:hypothetical protein
MLSREGIDKLWMKSKDIYEFARLIEAHTSSTAPKSMSWYMDENEIKEFTDGGQMNKHTLAEPEKANQCGETCERAKLCAVCANGLAQPKQKPVYQISLTNGPAKAAWIDVDEATYYSAKMDATYMARCLYAAPPARKPLMDEEVDKIIAEHVTITDQHLLAAVYMAIREVEQAHGIGGE